MSNPRLDRARISLEGLSVADALGGFFELGGWRTLPYLLQTRTLPTGIWHFTDDTNMALSIYEILRLHGRIDQDELVQSFAEHFERTRGYGMGARALLNAVREGGNWRERSKELFGEGSYGNGAAMRVAPLGAFFAEDDMSVVVQQAVLSSEITHAHPEGIAGGIAVAVATAQAWRVRDNPPNRSDFIDLVLPYIPEGEVKTGCVRARDLPPDASLADAVRALGNGSRITAQDTVPFVLWSAGEKLNDYEAAIWQTAEAGGDVDTTAAQVGGIVAMVTGVERIPTEWIAHREPLPQWALGEAS
jgi:ADP-ribosylglycohydrolase